HLSIFASRNPKLPKWEKIEFLKQSGISQSASERLLAADDPNTPGFVLRKLATDRDLRVIDAVLRNTSTPEGVLEGFTHLKRLEGWQDDIESFHREAEAELLKRRQSHPPTK